MNDDELSRILRGALATLKIGINADGIYFQEEHGFYRLRPIIDAVRASDSDAVTDDAWHLLRAIDDTLPAFLAKAPHLAASVNVRDNKEHLVDIIGDLRLRLVGRTVIESAWAGERSAHVDLTLVGMLDRLPYSYSGDIIDKNGQPHLLHVFFPHKTLEEAIEQNADTALYRVVDMPRIAWRSFEDGLMVLGEKCVLLRGIARKTGAYPLISPVVPPQLVN